MQVHMHFPSFQLACFFQALRHRINPVSLTDDTAAISNIVSCYQWKHWLIQAILSNPKQLWDVLEVQEMRLKCTCVLAFLLLHDVFNTLSKWYCSYVTYGTKPAGRRKCWSGNSVTDTSLKYKNQTKTYSMLRSTSGSHQKTYTESSQPLD